MCNYSAFTGASITCIKSSGLTTYPMHPFILVLCVWTFSKQLKRGRPPPPPPNKSPPPLTCNARQKSLKVHSYETCLLLLLPAGIDSYQYNDSKAFFLRVTSTEFSRLPPSNFRDENIIVCPTFWSKFDSSSSAILNDWKWIFAFSIGRLNRIVQGRLQCNPIRICILICGKLLWRKIKYSTTYDPKRFLLHSHHALIYCIAVHASMGFMSKE